MLRGLARVGPIGPIGPIGLIGLLGFAFAASALASTPAWETLAPDGSVTDHAEILSAADEAALEEALARFERETTNEIAVVTLGSLVGAPIEDVALHLGRRWGVGQEERDNGIVFLVAVEDREVRLEVGYGLEGAVPDAAANRIMESAIVPRFREGDYAGGIRDGLEALQQEIGGEYQAPARRQTDAVPVLSLFGIHFLVWGSLLFARTRSWWLGGILGGMVGAAAALLLRHWWPVPAFMLYGLVLDYLTSRFFYQHWTRGGRAGGWWFGGTGGGSSSRGGGFSFGGGSFGGGGASGRW